MIRNHKMLVVLLALCLMLFIWGTSILLNFFSTDIRVDESGGAYAYSLGLRWKAEVWDGFCKDNGKQYAVIYVWDLKKYPSMVEEGFMPMVGKKPEVKLVFPKNFQARASVSGVKWTSPSVFEVKFAGEDGPQVLRYDVSNHTFSLENKSKINE